ncbi:MAG TPA: hypothetical protein VGV07_22330 [Devosia sp.]|jgi:type II secretory pathway pseudopilin PulG|uniref:hypothetical protein n=1 Tax=Devosia sp. TaxID=1871048 RepID=UPI002DDCAC80|nr:hypothetical protein [Devosia sp.]HEV2518006.1 hypothetical protein [Devosia sp.]
MADSWVPTIAVAIVAALASFGGSLWGSSVTEKVETRKLDIQMVDIALQLLRSDSDDAKLRSARSFAIAALKEYSGLTLADATWLAWEESGTVPLFSNWTDFADPASLKKLWDTAKAAPTATELAP